MTREKRLQQIEKQLSKITAEGEGWAFNSDEGPTMHLHADETLTLCSVCAVPPCDDHICIAGVMGRTVEETFANAKFIGDAPKIINYLLKLARRRKTELIYMYDDGRRV